MPKVKKKTMPKVKNPQVFMEISIDSGEAKRITFELFANVVPKTAENFRALCTGERGLGAITQKPLSFKGTNFHRIIPGFIAQGGDFSKGNGLGGESIYGGNFPDESFKLKHDKRGLLSMANSGPHTNGSQFFITFEATPTLDNLHVVFGKVISGLELLKLVEEAGSPDGVPPSPVLIVDCGEVSSDTKRSRKRKHCSDSYSSDTSDSRDHRNKRRKRSKKDKRKSTKRNGKHTKRRKTRGSKRKSRRSYGSSSEDLESRTSESSSSDSESAGHLTKPSLPKAAGQENTCSGRDAGGSNHRSSSPSANRGRSKSMSKSLRSRSRSRSY